MNTLCLAHWLFDSEEPIDIEAERSDIYYWHECFADYEAMNLPVEPSA